MSTLGELEELVRSIANPPPPPPPSPMDLIFGRPGAGKALFNARFGMARSSLSPAIAAWEELHSTLSAERLRHLSPTEEVLSGTAHRLHLAALAAKLAEVTELLESESPLPTPESFLRTLELAHRREAGAFRPTLRIPVRAWAALEATDASRIIKERWRVEPSSRVREDEVRVIAGASEFRRALPAAPSGLRHTKLLIVDEAWSLTGNWDLSGTAYPVPLADLGVEGIDVYGTFRADGMGARRASDATRAVLGL